MNLQQTQMLFWKAARREAHPEEIEECFVGNQRMSAQGRMQVYAGSFFVRQEKALAEFLPKTKQLLGPDFSKVARAYALEHPGREAPLETFPSQFSHFLTHCGENLAGQMAQLESTRARALLAPLEKPSLTADDMARLTPSHPLRATRALTMATVGREAALLFLNNESASQTGQRPELPGEPSGQRPELPGQPGEQQVTFLFVRKGFQVHQRVVLQDEKRALEDLLEGTTLSALCEAFSCHVDPISRAHEVLSLFLKHEILIDSSDCKK